MVYCGVVDGLVGCDDVVLCVYCVWFLMFGECDCIDVVLVDVGECDVG